jgi:hypothetical protein
LAFGGSGLIREMTSMEGDNLVVFYYLTASVVGIWWEWPYKRDDLYGGEII